MRLLCAYGISGVSLCDVSMANNEITSHSKTGHVPLNGMELIYVACFAFVFLTSFVRSVPNLFCALMSWLGYVVCGRLGH